MKFYSITCHRGHCGIGRSSEITFVFQTNNLLDAMDSAKRMPGVKHTRMIISAKEITEQEYYRYRKISAYDRKPMGNRAK